SFTIPAGLTGKLWVTINASKIPSGQYKNTLIITSGDQHLTAPMNINVFPVKMGKPKISLMVWDYTNGNGKYGITPENRHAAIKLMRSHFVDSPWASKSSLPSPRAKNFNTINQLNTRLNFSNLDQWVAMWP